MTDSAEELRSPVLFSGNGNGLQKAADAGQGSAVKG
jgi:hypothetical protein